MKNFLIKFLALFNALEGIIHIVVAVLGFWGIFATNTWDWRVVTPPVENLVFGLFSLFTGLVLGKWGHDHHHHIGSSEMK